MSRSVPSATQAPAAFWWVSAVAMMPLPFTQPLGLRVKVSGRRS